MPIAPPIRDPNEAEGMLPFGGASEPPEAQPDAAPDVSVPAQLPTSPLGAEVAPGQQIPPQEVHHARMKGLEESAAAHRQAAAANADALGSLDVSDPDFYKKMLKYTGQHNALHTAHGEIQQAKAEEEQANPWGTIGNHPGIGGKIGHAFGVLGNVAGNAILGKENMSGIPGSQAALEKEKAGGAAEQAEAAKETEEGARGEEAQATASEAPSKIKLNEAQAEKAGEGPSRNADEMYMDAEVAAGKTAEQARQGLEELKAENKPEKGPTQEQNKLAFQGVVQKAAAAGLSTDPKELNKSLYKAQQAGKITPEEFANAMAYQAANTTPGTNLTVHVEGQQAGEGIKEGAQFYAVNGKMVRGRDLTPEQRANATPVRDPEKAMESVQATNSTVKAFQRYKNAIDTANLSPDDVKALQVLTAAQPIAHSYLDKEVGGVLDTLFGEPLTGYSEKAMGGIMTKDQYDKLSPAGQKALVGYYNALIANFADMKHRLGGIGRNESMIQAEIHTIPLPYINKQAADEAFNQKLTDIEGRNIYMQGGGQGEAKSAAAPAVAGGGGEFKVPEGAPAAPKEDGHKLHPKGHPDQTIAISKGGQWTAP